MTVMFQIASFTTCTNKKEDLL